MLLDDKSGILDTAVNYETTPFINYNGDDEEETS